MHAGSSLSYGLCWAYVSDMFLGSPYITVLCREYFRGCSVNIPATLVVGLIGSIVWFLAENRAIPLHRNCLLKIRFGSPAPSGSVILHVHTHLRVAAFVLLCFLRLRLFALHRIASLSDSL